MKRLIALASSVFFLVSLVVATSHADAPQFRTYKLSSTDPADAKLKARPGIYDPDHTGSVIAQWVSGVGEQDDRGNGNFGLYLQKAAPTATNSASGAIIDGVQGTHATQLGFDYRNDSHCGAGAPRFDVFTNDNVDHFFGCAYGTHTSAPTAGWTRVTFSPADGFPVITPGETVSAIQVIFDEGVDQGNGYAYLDNINYNGQYITKPGAAH